MRFLDPKRVQKQTGRTDGRTNERTNERTHTHGFVYGPHTISPSGNNVMGILENLDIGGGRWGS